MSCIVKDFLRELACAEPLFLVSTLADRDWETMSGNTLTDVDELHNDTGLSFTWAATGSNNQVSANVTGGALRDEANGIYSWCQTSQEGVGPSLANGVELFGATVLSFGGTNTIIITGIDLEQSVASTPQDIFDFDQGYDVYFIFNRITI